jgi:hypothetical protein
MTTNPLYCPHCRKPATLAHLKANPDCASACQSLMGLYRLSRRTTPPKPGPGRKPRKPSLLQFIASEANSHPSNCDCASCQVARILITQTK